MNDRLDTYEREELGDNVRSKNIMRKQCTDVPLARINGIS